MVCSQNQDNYVVVKLHIDLITPLVNAISMVFIQELKLYSKDTNENKELNSDL